MEIQNLFTGIWLEDVPKAPFESFRASATGKMTSSIMELSQGKAQRARLPQFARSALVFRPRLHGKIPDSVRNMTLLITDSKGKENPNVQTRLYKGADAWVFLMDAKLPLTDGNFQFELTILEDPPAESGEWTAMAPVTPGKTDGDSTVAVSIKGKEFRAGMTEGADRINLETKRDPSLVSIIAEQTGTSNTLAVISLEGRRWDEHYRSTLTLAEPVSSGSVTLKFASPIEHKVTFSGVPVRP